MHMQVRVPPFTHHPRWNGTVLRSMTSKSVKVGGMQCLTTLDGFAIPLDMQRGLPYLNNADVSILWSPSNVNDDSILMGNLCHLLNAFPFDGHSVVCDPNVILAALMTVWTMGRREQSIV